jgi:hypothetical protein
MDAGETTPGGRDGSTGNGDSSGSGGGGESGATGGSGGSGGSAGSSGAGSAGSGNGCVPAWRTQSSTDSFDDLGLPPGNEDNTQWVYQYICRGTPAGQTALLLGKGVPGFGCYGTYAEGTTRHGFGIENDFEVLVPSASCATTWQPVTAGVIPLELGKVPGLYACRGVLTNEPYPGGVASGLELGQWVPAAGGGDFECWTQFHDDGQKDHGSKRVEREVEVLVHAP